MPAPPQGQTCARCSAPISTSAPEGLCPACVLTSAASAFTLSAPAAASFPAPELASYEILEVIGQGGMGIVYQARQKRLNRVVALKVILAGALASQKEVRRFEVEAQAVARLRHPNIVAIHEVGWENGHHFFSMEFVEGKSLADAFRARTLSLPQAAALIRKVAEAVHYAHQQGILHRDLKPANILIDEKGEPRITDFGLARQLHLESDLTVTGAIIGTPSYMPPEQARGEARQLTIPSDVYSLGAILYEALTGRPPFRADTLLETLRQVVEIPPAAPRLLNPKIPRDLEVIALKCLRKEPAARYASAGELADDLQRFHNAEPIHARPIGMLERNVSWLRRNRLSAAALTAAAFLLILLSTAAFLFRNDLLQSNVASASLAARIITSYLHEMSQPVLQLAADPAFQRLVSQRDTNAIRQLLHHHSQSLSLTDTRSNVVGNWVLMAPNGDTIVRQPDSPDFRLDTRAGRDYFRGAVQLFETGRTREPHFSRVYKSVEDQFFKIGLSTPVPNPENPAALSGVLCLMLKTDSTESQRLQLNDPRQKTVLFGRWDEFPGQEITPGAPIKWVIWLHPQFRAGDPAIAVTREMPFEGRTRSSFHFDPAAKIYKPYRGPWLAGFAQVPGAPFVVLVQSRDWVGVFFLTALICTLLVGALFEGSRLWRKYRSPTV